MLLCNLAGEDEVGSTFHFPFWLKLLGNQKEMKWQLGEGEEETLPAQGRICFVFCVSYKNQARIRMTMSIIVNLFIRQIIFSTAPILLSVADDTLEFIKDSLAVFFITKLDDLDNPISFLRDLNRKRKNDTHTDEFMSILFGTGNMFEEEAWASQEETAAKFAAIEKRMEALEQKSK